MVSTVGHSTRTGEAFLALLAAHQIAVVVDVRRFPGSRRYPHFAREALAAALAARLIDYRHAPDLGGRRRARPDSPHTGWRAAGFRGYADHMETAEFQAALDGVISLGAERRVALMCAEAVPWRCHRQLIADALVARGVPVHHILGLDRADPHVPPSFARFEPSGRVVYGPASDPTLL
jgi:uncharacterized protein (DUF488 family)